MLQFCHFILLYCTYLERWINQKIDVFYKTFLSKPRIELSCNFMLWRFLLNVCACLLDPVSQSICVILVFIVILGFSQKHFQYKNHFHNYVITYGDKGHKCRWHHTRYLSEANKNKNKTTKYKLSIWYQAYILARKE